MKHPAQYTPPRVQSGTGSYGHSPVCRRGDTAMKQYRRSFRPGRALPHPRIRPVQAGFAQERGNHNFLKQCGVHCFLESHDRDCRTIG